MRVDHTEIPGLVLLEIKVFQDERGYFYEAFQEQRYRDAGITHEFVQDNFSHSQRGALRGMHYQWKQPQGKLVHVPHGEVFDVVVDLRNSSPVFGAWCGLVLSEENRKQLYVPAGCAHGFCVLSDTADFVYKCTNFYQPGDEYTILWNDPQLGIEWPINKPLISEKDRGGLPFSDAPHYDS
ncbi:dTDP-4-dehydrorhamnose 3,5-epimerase [Calycomorphotria hydatis]|uniref:dTDP-4-dehydrorhamnose 3,5-epimerase n=1 Tax=Calycomorphotria hydatis TaxID=2528027 RepID=A0A517TEF2_9PLAN|nr:dTDP-4-dehydrorhamnose 3,5-epimerase [Calycomorphotria hydatis]QDT66745.1 dTDP-4-dehydrorhamnose 3,5-epimerase [Calycomorphotria hydatis]